MPALKRVCVYAGSRDGLEPAYRAAAEDLGRTLAREGIGLVYGGGRVGLMGALADAAMAAGAEVTGVIPQALVEKEVAHPGVADMRVVDSMHARKALMADLADAFIALPGGVGTLEELIEVVTWTQLGLQSKPSGLLNVDGYYDRLIEFLDHATGQGFIDPLHRTMLLVSERPSSLLERLAGWRPPRLVRWIDRTQA